MGIVIFILGLGLAVASPIFALQLLVVLAPFETISKFVGVDPRTYLAASLALRAAYDQAVHGARIPVRVQVVWSAFVVIAAGMFWGQPASMDASEIEKARYIFQYVIAASFAAFAIMQLCRGTRDRHRLVTAFSISVVWVSIATIVEAIVGFINGSGERITGPLGHQNPLGSFLAISATILLMLQVRELLSRRYSYLVSLLAWIGCALALSRASIIAAVTGYLLHCFCTSPSPHRLRHLIVGGFSVAAVFFLLATTLTEVRLQLLFQHDAQHEKAAQFSQSLSDLGRLEASLFAAKLFEEHPMLGAGMGTFAARNYDRNGIYLVTHNTCLEVLAETGLVGAALLALGVCWLWRVLPRASRVSLVPTVTCWCVNAAFIDYLYLMHMAVALAVAYVAASTDKPGLLFTSRAPSQSQTLESLESIAHATTCNSPSGTTTRDDRSSMAT